MDRFEARLSVNDEAIANLNNALEGNIPGNLPPTVNPDTDPTAGSGETPAVSTADVRDQAEIPTNTSGYGEQDELAVSAADVRTAPSIIGDEDAQQAAFQTFAAPGDEDAQQAPFGVFNSQNRVQVGTIQAQRQD